MQPGSRKYHSSTAIEGLRCCGACRSVMRLKALCLFSHMLLLPSTKLYTLLLPHTR